MAEMPHRNLLTAITGCAIGLGLGATAGVWWGRRIPGHIFRDGEDWYVDEPVLRELQRRIHWSGGSAGQGYIFGLFGQGAIRLLPTDRDPARTDRRPVRGAFAAQRRPGARVRHARPGDPPRRQAQADPLHAAPGPRAHGPGPRRGARRYTGGQPITSALSGRVVKSWQASAHSHASSSAGLAVTEGAFALAALAGPARDLRPRGSPRRRPPPTARRGRRSRQLARTPGSTAPTAAATCASTSTAARSARSSRSPTSRPDPSPASPTTRPSSSSRACSSTSATPPPPSRAPPHRGQPREPLRRLGPALDPHRRALPGRPLDRGPRSTDQMTLTPVTQPQKAVTAGALAGLLVASLWPTKQ
jgi:hypothetical protein